MVSDLKAHALRLPKAFLETTFAEALKIADKDLMFQQSLKKKKTKMGGQDLRFTKRKGNDLISAKIRYMIWYYATNRTKGVIDEKTRNNDTEAD